MSEKLVVNYFYGQDVQMSQFYRIPKTLYSAECFKDVSFAAKAIYGMMIDRVGLSIKNQWLDEEGKTYICYSIEEIMEDSNCKRSSVIKALEQLRDVGLIETVRRGQGLSSIIYVKNFELVEEGSAESRSLESEFLEVQNSNFQKSENETSRSMENKPLEVQNPNSNNTKKNNIYINNTNHILSISDNKTDEMDSIEEYQAYSEIIKENIEYSALIERHPYERDMVEGIFDLILETVITQKESVHVSGQEYPAELVKSKFLKLNYSHIEYVLGCMGKNTTKIHNIKSYLLTALFNAGSTMSSYYKAMVNHDLPQFAG